jgi:hypothetical protein
MQTRAGNPLVELHQDFAFLETPKRWRDGPDIQREGRQVQQMVENAGDFAEQHADILTALRHLDAKQPFHGQGIGVLLTHRRDIVQPVEIGHRL